MPGCITEKKAVSFQEPGATCSMTNWEAPFHAARRKDQPGAEFPTVTPRRSLLRVAFPTARPRAPEKAADAELPAVAPRRLTMPCAGLPCGRSAQRYPKTTTRSYVSAMIMAATATSAAQPPATAAQTTAHLTPLSARSTCACRSCRSDSRRSRNPSRNPTVSCLI